MVNGAYLRSLRQNRNYTLERLSRETGYTASFLSQIERGLKEPSLTTLRKLSECLGVPIFSFFVESSEEGAASGEEMGYSVVRKDLRTKMDFPGLAIKGEAITRFPGAGGAKPALRGILYTISSGQWSSEGLVSHTYDECTYVLQGSIRIAFPDASVEISAGDCIYICAGMKHNFFCREDEDSVLLAFNN